MTQGFFQNTLFGQSGYAIQCASNIYVNLNACHFGNSLTPVLVTTGSFCVLLSCDFTKHVYHGQQCLTVTDAGTTCLTTSCLFDGSNPLQNIAGNGCLVKQSAMLTIEGGQVMNCVTGVQCGLNSDTSSTQVALSGTNFLSNTTSVYLPGTASFFGNLFTIDALSSLNFVSTLNVRINVASTSNNVNTPYLFMGPFQNAACTLIGVATSSSNFPTFQYSPSVYSNSAFVFSHPTSASSVQSVSAGSSAMGSISRSLSQTAQLNLFSDTSIVFGDASQVRGWTLTKQTNPNTTLDIVYKNNIAGQPTLLGQTMMSIDAIANQVNFLSSSLTWSGGSSLSEASPLVLTSNANLILSPLTPNTALVTNGSSQLVSSSVTATQLGFLAGVTSNVQTQLNGKASLAGAAFSGAINSTFAGSPSNPNYAINNSSGMYSSGSNILDFATNNTDQLRIDSSGNVSIFAFSSQGIVHNASNGLLSSSLIGTIRCGQQCDHQCQTGHCVQYQQSELRCGSGWFW